MAEHPYKSQPRQAFWSKAVSDGYDAKQLISTSEPLISPDDLVVSAGSCFASNLVPYLERAGLTYLRTELPHPAFVHLPENLGYRNFSAAYGNIYTTRQLRQLLDRALGLFQPVEDRWYIDGKVIDPFRPGLRYPARTDEEFDALTAQHLAAVRRAFQQATVMVFTLGLTEAWESTIDGAVYPACPGTINGSFDPERHRFRNFTVDEVRDDLLAFLYLVRTFNPDVRLILTVSPVPLVATATDGHVLVATTYSKSVLRVAAQGVADADPKTTYFPSYEIVTGPQAPESFFEADRRNVSEEGVNFVMRALLAHCEWTPRWSNAQSSSSADGLAPETAAQQASIREAIEPAPKPAAEPRPMPRIAMSLSEAVAAAECDEAMADVAI